MKRLLLIVSLFLVFVSTLQAAAVVFNDTNLRHDVMMQHVPPIDPNLTGQPTQADMNGLIYLDSSSRGISDLTGLETAINLTTLKLRNNNITNISPLSSLTKLTHLYLSTHNDISDINALSGMTQLVELGLTDVNVSTITPLGNIADVNNKNLQYLWLGTNRIKDVNSLTKFRNLKILALTLNPMNFDSWTVYLKEILFNNPGLVVPPTPSSYISSSPLIANYSTDMKDMDTFANKWLRTNCSLSNAYCGGTDFDGSGVVDFVDFGIFADWWMYQP